MAATFEDRHFPCHFVKDLRERTLQKLATVLDAPDSLRNWKFLAKRMTNYRLQDIQTFERAQQRRGGSPTKELLKDWGSRNNTVRDLVRFLDQIGNDAAVRILTQPQGKCGTKINRWCTHRLHSLFSYPAMMLRLLLRFR